MNTVGPALPSAVAGTRPARQPAAQSTAAASWDATYDDARGAADADSGSHSHEPANNAVAAGGTNGKPTTTVSAPSQTGNAQSQSAIGTVMARQGTPPVSIPASGQSNGGSGTVPVPPSNGTTVGDPTTTAATPVDDTSAGANTAGDPTAAGQSSDTDQPTGASTATSHGKPTDGAARTIIGKASKSPDNPGDMRTDQQDGTDRTAESDNAADQDSSADSSLASVSAKPSQPESRTDKLTSRPAQTRHAPPDAPSGSVPSADAQVALSQSALGANSPNEADQAKKSDDRDSIVLAAGATSSTAAPSLTPAPTVHGAAAAQDPDPPAQELLHHTATNLVTDGGGTARIVLTPPTLGHVEVSVTMAPSGAAHIAITAATADGYAALTASHAGLLQHLAQRGVSVGSVQTQLQGNAGQNNASGGDGRQRHNQSASAVPWVKKGQDETVIAYA